MLGRCGGLDGRTVAMAGSPWFWLLCWARSRASGRRGAGVLGRWRGWCLRLFWQRLWSGGSGILHGRGSGRRVLRRFAPPEPTGEGEGES